MIPKLDPNNLPAGPRTVVLYHFPCADGLASLVAAKRRLNEFHKGGQAAIHAIPVNYGSPARPRPIPYDEIASIKPELVLIVDFSYQPHEIETLCERVPSLRFVHMIDHHATAIKDWLESDHKPESVSYTVSSQQLRYKMADKPVGFTYPRDDYKKQLAGTGLTWNVMTPEGQDKLVGMPYGFKLINDRDLWNLNDDNRRFHAYVSTYLFREEAFGELDKILNGAGDFATVQSAIQEGKSLLAARAHITNELIGSSLKFGRMLGGFNYDDGTSVTHLDCLWRFALIDCPGMLSSDACQMVWDKCDAANQHIDFVVTWSTNPDGMVHLSLRSRDTSYCDASSIAKALGGGGHRNACGVSGISIAKFMDCFFHLERDLKDLPDRHREAGFVIVPDWSHFLRWLKPNTTGVCPGPSSSMEGQQQYLEEMLVPNVIHRHLNPTK